MNNEKAFPGIEICRFFCAVAVVVYHYQHFFVQGFWTIDHTEPRTAFPLYPALAPLYHQGSLAVLVFWAISGFIFYWRYADPIHSRAVDGGRFFVWRLSRLYPLHILSLGAVALLQTLYLRHHDEPFVYPLEAINLQYLFASNWTTLSPKTFNGPIWSVSVEVLIYAIFFFIARLLRPSLVSCLGVCVIAAAISFARFAIYFSDLLECAILFFGGGFFCVLIARLDSAARRKLFWLAVSIVRCCDLRLD
jgi:peptidoglycan/LPS O-acetylase OafA/YrhL